MHNKYIYSDTFQYEPLRQIFENCAKLASGETPEIDKFWKANLGLLLSYLEGNPLALVSIKQFILLGYYPLVAYMSGLQSGHQIGKNTVQTQMIENVGVLYENLLKKNQELISEQKAHRSQTQEWINQIGNASKVVAGFQHSVEQVKLGMLKLETLPTPMTTEDPGQPLPDIQDFDTSSTSHYSVKQTIYQLKHDGVYCSKFGILKISNGIITAWDSIDNSFQSFKILTGRHANYAYIIFNRNLNEMKLKLIQDPFWLSKCFDENKLLDRSVLTITLKEVSKGYNQWYKEDLTTDE